MPEWLSSGLDLYIMYERALEGATRGRRLATLTFIAVLISALIQAGWNFLAKKSTCKPSMLIFSGWFLLGMMFVPVAHVVTGNYSLSSQAAQFIFASSAIHVVYILLLGAAYQSGELSIVYPLSRGGGIAWTSLFVLLLSDVRLSPFGIVGIALVVLASALMVSGEIKKKHRAASLRLAAAIGFIIGVYSFIDSKAVKTVHPVIFLAWVNLVCSLLALPFVWKRNREEITKIIKFHKSQALIVASGGSLAYLIILYAYQLAPAPYIVALREVSVLFAAALGILILKEHPSRLKICGVVLISVGAVIIRIA